MLDGFSQFSFDWENSHAHSQQGGFSGTPDRSSLLAAAGGRGGGGGSSSNHTPLLARRALLESRTETAGTETAGTVTETESSAGAGAAGAGGEGGGQTTLTLSRGSHLDTEFDPEGEFSNLINPGDEFSLNIA
jgi:hypothetical protein